MDTILNERFPWPPIAGGQDDGEDDGGDDSGMEGGSAGAGAPGPGGVNAGTGGFGDTTGGGFGGLNAGDSFNSGGFGSGGIGLGGLNTGDSFNSGGFGFGGPQAGLGGDIPGASYGGTGPGFGGGNPAFGSGPAMAGEFGTTAQTGALGGVVQQGIDLGAAPTQQQINAALQSDVNASLAGPAQQTGTPLYPSLASIPLIGSLLQKGVTGLGSLLHMGPATGVANTPSPAPSQQHSEGNAQAGFNALAMPNATAQAAPAAGGAPVNAPATTPTSPWPGAPGTTGSGPWPGASGTASAPTGMGTAAAQGTSATPPTLPADPWAALNQAVYQYGASSPQAAALLPYVQQQFANPQAYQRQVAAQQQQALVNQIAQQVQAQTGITPGSGASATGSVASGTTGAAGADNVQSKLLSAYDQLIPFLQSPNLLDTPEGQAVYASASNQINAQYAQQRQEILTRAAQQGLAPTSGVVQQELAQLDQQKQADLSNVQNYYTQQYTQNMETSVNALTNLLNLDTAQNAQGLADQMAIDSFDQQTVGDLLNAIGVGSGSLNSASSNAANISGNLLSYASQLGAQYQNIAANSYAGLGSIAQALASGGFNTTGSPLGSSVNNTGSGIPTSSVIGSPNLMSLMA